MRPDFHPSRRDINLAALRLGPDTANRVLVPTNGQVRRDGRAVMGAGVAKIFRDRIKGLDLQLGGLINSYGSRVQMIEPRVYAFPTKDRWRDPADLEIIKQSARELVDLVTAESSQLRWFLPAPGCGSGGLQYFNVLKEILPILDFPRSNQINLCATGEEFDKMCHAFNLALGHLESPIQDEEQTADDVVWVDDVSSEEEPDDEDGEGIPF